jgi:hypothetical protein
MPYYIGYPRTYGVGVQYNYYGGGYYAQKSVYGPYGTASRSAWYNPSTGLYGRAATAQSAAGGATVGQAYNPWTGTYAATRQGSNAYSQWGSSVAVRGNQWAQTAHRSTANGTVAGARTSGGASIVGGAGRGGSGFVGRDKDNNLYAGKDGNVYKKDSSGTWRKYGNGGWSGVNPPATPYNAAQTPQQRTAAQGRLTTAMQPPTAQPATTRQARPSLTSDSATRTHRMLPSASQSPAVSRNPIQQLDRDEAARQRGAQQARQYRQSGAAGNRASGQVPRRPR